MKQETVITILVCSILVTLIGSIIKDARHIKKVNNMEYVIDSLKNEINIKDSIYNNVVSKSKYDSICTLHATYIYLHDKELLEAQDYIDSLSDELSVANLKLERIKEYNRIAGQGNNITFLRGWINRVLNE